ncbi:HPP family protein [Caldiplasma sukawensis]
MDRSVKLLKYTEFAIILLIIVYLNYRFSYSLLLSPPFAVTAYLSIFKNKESYSKASSIIISYVIVVLSTELFHITLGLGYLSLTFNVLLISFFITFTEFNHPPAIALTIFSYISHSPEKFVISSISIALLIIVWKYICDYINEKRAID